MNSVERQTRVKHMKTFGQWLKDNGRTQRWAGIQLGIYHGYVSNLVTGKQVASEEVCRTAGRLMGPINMETGKPAGPTWTSFEIKVKQQQQIVKEQEKEPIPAQKPVLGNPRLPTSIEIEAAATITTAWLRTAPPKMVTPGGVLDVIKGVIAGFVRD